MKQLLRIAIFTVIGSSIRQALRRFHSFFNGIAVACKLSWVKLVDSVFYWNLRRLYLVYCLFYFSTRSNSRAMQDGRVLFYHDNFKFYSLIGLQHLVFTSSHNLLDRSNHLFWVCIGSIHFGFHWTQMSEFKRISMAVYSHPSSCVQTTYWTNVDKIYNKHAFGVNQWKKTRTVGYV